MSSAQSRQLKAAAQRIVRVTKARDELLDVLNALLHHHGGRLEVPLGAVESASRQEVVLEFQPDRLIIATKARMDADGERDGILGRLRALVGV